VLGMARLLAFTVALVAAALLIQAVGCTSTSPGEVGADGSTMTPDVQSGGPSPDGPNESDIEGSMPFSIDAGQCPPDGVPTLTFDEQLAYECHRDAGMFSLVGVSTTECGGVIAIIVQRGVDTQTMYLYDPSTKACLEVAGGANGFNDCVASASGVPLATSCTFATATQGFNGHGPFGFVDACGTDGGAAGDSATDAGTADTGVSDAAPDGGPLDASGE
jgi:hypothetical protein